MGTVHPHTLHEVQGGGVSPYMVWKPVWTQNYNYQEYGTPVELGTSDPGSANYTWTIDSGDFPQVDSDSGAWALLEQSNGNLALAAHMQFWGRNENAGSATVSFKRYHKYGGGSTDETSSSAGTTSSIASNAYWRSHVSWNVGSNAFTDARPIVVDDLVGVRLWASVSSVYLYHRCMTLMIGAWRGLPGTVYENFTVSPNNMTSDAKTDYGLAAGWGTTSAGQSGTMALDNGCTAALSTTDINGYALALSQTVGMRSGGVVSASLTNAPSLLNNSNATQSSVSHAVARLVMGLSGSRRRANI